MGTLQGNLDCFRRKLREELHIGSQRACRVPRVICELQGHEACHLGGLDVSAARHGHDRACEYREPVVGHADQFLYPFEVVSNNRCNLAHRYRCVTIVEYKIGQLCRDNRVVFDPAQQILVKVQPVEEIKLFLGWCAGQDLIE